MKNGIVISDAGPIFSLAVIDQLHLLDQLFDEIFIPTAVWIELTRDTNTTFFERIVQYFNTKVKDISRSNELSLIMDYGESEAVILYRELDANFLLIDDKRARKIAESLDINCIGTLGILITAKKRGLIDALKPFFENLLQNQRYYSLKLLNRILLQHGEPEIENPGKNEKLG